MTKNKNKNKNVVTTSEATTVVVVGEDGTNTVETLQMKPSVDILEMKLTRSELIDLITEEVETDLKKKQAAIQKQSKELSKEITKHVEDLSDEEIINSFILPTLKKNLGKMRANSKRDGVYYLADRKAISLGHFYAEITIPEEYLGKIKKLNKDLEEVNQKIYKLGSKSGKNEIMKQMLSASDEGKKLLSQIQNFKKGANKLIGA